MSMEMFSPIVSMNNKLESASHGRDEIHITCKTAKFYNLDLSGFKLFSFIFRKDVKGHQNQIVLQDYVPINANLVNVNNLGEGGQIIIYQLLIGNM